MNFCPKKRVGINFKTLKNGLNIDCLEFNIFFVSANEYSFPIFINRTSTIAGFIRYAVYEYYNIRDVLLVYFFTFIIFSFVFCVG
jgi:hypothetical protein